MFTGSMWTSDTPVPFERRERDLMGSKLVAYPFSAKFPLVLLLLLSGCALPVAGPETAQFLDQADNPETASFGLVDVGPWMIPYASERHRASLRALFGEGPRHPDLRIAIGDVIAVNLWEAPPGSLFGTAAALTESGQSTGGSVSIPPQTVARDGTIAVPYAGRISVAGRTPAAVEQKITEALAGKAVQPQALVTIERSTANAVTVTGEVAGGARIGLTAAGERVLDAVAAAGGLRASVTESMIYFTRNGRTVRIPFETIVRNPSENIRLQPGDIVTVVREPQTFLAFGATGRNAEIPFETPELSMAEALAKVGGLLDNRADAAGVFLLRFEPLSVARHLLPANSPVLRRPSPVPIVYRFNLHDPNVMIAMQRFEVRPQDVIYVSNAPAIEWQKFLSIFQGLSGQAYSAASIGITAAAAQ